MDLQTQLEHMTEKNWSKEKMELLERFDSERKEWECQWKVMQKKIEELYQEVKLRRENNMSISENKPIHNKAEQQACSPTLEWSDPPGLHSCSPDKESLQSKPEKESKCVKNKRRNHAFAKDHLTFQTSKESEDCELNCTHILQFLFLKALKELAKVSEDLCTYQEEIRKKANHRSSLHIVPNNLVNPDPQLAAAASEMEKQNNRKNLVSTNRHLKEAPSTALPGVEETSFLPWQRREGPPVPPRSTSRHLTSSLADISEALAKHVEQRNSWETEEHPDGSSLIYPAAPLTVSDECKSLSGPTENQDQYNDLKFPAAILHSVWSCDASKIENGPENGFSRHALQKCSSDGYMMTPKQHPKLQSSIHCTSNPYVAACDTLEDSGYETGKTQRNETLEAKIDEFNRTVFHTDKGKKCLLQNQTEPSGVPKVHCGLQDSLNNGTQNEEPICVLNSKLSSKKEEKANKPSKDIKTKRQQKQINGVLSSYQHMLHEHDWRPSNLSGRPRSADSRSNYGVVEKLLKNYEKQVQSETEFTESSCKKMGHYPVIQTEQGKQEQQKNSFCPVQRAGCLKLSKVSLAAKQSNGKAFSRPARPANRRLPSRWASRSPSAPPAMRRTRLDEIA
uniref:KIAA0408 n=1 Tax=Pseudonaja textilis TaxID=8673 RepID=A0A670XZ60_PSETE